MPKVFEIDGYRGLVRALFLLGLTGMCLRGADEAPLMEKGPFNPEAGETCATLAVRFSVVHWGKDLIVESRFYNGYSSQTFDYFNPFLNPLLPLPVKLGLYDRDKKFVRDLLEFREGSRAIPGADSVVFIPQSGNIGTTLRIRFFPDDIAPGRYFLQMIYLQAFQDYRGFFPDSSLTANQVKEWRDRIGREMLRSNPVEFTVEK